MNNTKHAIFVTLYSIVVKGKSHYSVARPGTLLNLLKNFHEIEIKYRWLFQCIADIQDAGYIKRRRRFRLQIDGDIRRLPQLVVITARGVKYLKSKMIEGSGSMFKRIIAWLKKADHRFPKPQDITHPQAISDRNDALVNIREIIKAVL